MKKILVNHSLKMFWKRIQFTSQKLVTAKASISLLALS